jgi:16S rRNA G966 N2-methylase RsmD
VIALPEIIPARTHPPEYLMHKYWARKPHNVISTFIESLVPEGGLIVDPYCGSGVVLREAAIRGIQSVGFDINPIAVLISRVTAQPPGLEEFNKVVCPLVESFEKRAFSEYGYSVDGQTVRYVVHAIVAACPQCGAESTPEETPREGRTYKCLSCSNRIKFNLESLIRTRVSELILDADGSLVSDRDVLATQEHLSESVSFLSPEVRVSYSKPFEANRRTLAYAGMHTKDLYTSRNFSFLCEVAETFYAIKSSSVRDGALMLLTASAAQASRLIPYRQRSSTGGPAWSVPGFWVPGVHLETNPAVHLRARLKKFQRGLEALHKTPIRTAVSVERRDAAEGLRALVERGERADLVFLDPPYGDSVPYLEFSSLWNSFLKSCPSADADISVSDRLDRTTAWTRYEAGLKETIKSAREALKPEGRILLTFNNNDSRAWAALLGALQSAHLRCEYITYQIPAVISSKAQFSPKGSYLSDFYAIYSPAPDTSEVISDLGVVEKALRRCASSRGGRVARNLVLRAAMVAWVADNVSADLLPQRDNLILRLFEGNGETLTWRGEIDQAVPRLEQVVAAVTERMSPEGDWATLYSAVASMMLDSTVPDPSEIRALLNGKWPPPKHKDLRLNGQLDLLALQS